MRVVQEDWAVHCWGVLIDISEENNVGRRIVNNCSLDATSLYTTVEYFQIISPLPFIKPLFPVSLSQRGPCCGYVSP